MVSYFARWLPTSRSPHARLLFYDFCTVLRRQAVLVGSAGIVGTGTRRPVAPYLSPPVTCCNTVFLGE